MLIALMCLCMDRNNSYVIQNYEGYDYGAYDDMNVGTSVVSSLWMQQHGGQDSRIAISAYTSIYLYPHSNDMYVLSWILG